MRSSILVVLLVGVVCSCTPLPELPQLDHADVIPPVLTAVELTDAYTLRVSFDEPAQFITSSLFCSDTISSYPTVHAEKASLAFRFDPAPAPGVEHAVEAQVRDATGNQLRFLVGFYGTNTLLPAMIINEFTTQGGGNHPDLVELLVLSEGNLAGVCIYEGTPGNWEQRFVFPDLDVRAGEFVLVHFKPEGIAAEVDETRSKSDSGGLDASPTAWDFWVPEGSGLSGNNGAITLCANPNGSILDAVLYSNRTSESDERYRGFGSRDVMERADELHAAGAWSAAGVAVAPEDAVNPEPSTATRSICRSTGGEDTNGRADWHVVPTGGYTFGAPNSNEVYVP